MLVRQQLQALAEDGHKQFTEKLIPQQQNILGVRMPHLRKLAKTLAREQAVTYLATAQDDYFEEVVLQGLVIGLVKLPWQELVPYIEAFIPKIDNWSTCDSFCSSLKIAKQQPQQVYAFITPYFTAPTPYEQRFAIVMALNYFIDSEHIDELFAYFDNNDSTHYYVQMAIAWAVSICYIKLPEQTLAYIQHNELNNFTHNKAIQKITESTRVSTANKSLLRTFKRSLK